MKPLVLYFSPKNIFFKIKLTKLDKLSKLYYIYYIYNNTNYERI